MAELGPIREDTVLDTPATGVPSATEDQKRTTANTGGEQRGTSRVSKHNAPNRGATSRPPPSCRSKHRIEAFARRHPITPRERGKWRTRSATPPRRGMTSTGAIIAGSAKAMQDFHPRIAHLHTSLELAALSKKPHTAATAAHADVAAKPRTDCLAEVTAATPPTASLHEEPQPTSTSGQVQDRPRRLSPIPRDSLATIRPASPRTTPRPAPPGEHRRSPRRTEVTDRSLLAKTPSWLSHRSAATNLPVESRRRHQNEPQLRWRTPPGLPHHQPSCRAPATSPHIRPA